MTFFAKFFAIFIPIFPLKISKKFPFLPQNYLKITIFWQFLKNFENPQKIENQKTEKTPEISPKK